MAGRCAEDVLRSTEPPGFDALVWQALSSLRCLCPIFEHTEAPVMNSSSRRLLLKKQESGVRA